MTTLIAMAEALEQSSIGQSIAESRYLWPVLEGTHLLSQAVSFGLILMIDLRLIGLILGEIPVIDLLRQLRRFVLTGFALTFVSGALVFWSEASSVITSPLWAAKCIAIAAGGANAAYFEWAIARQPSVRDNRGPLPPSVRYAGVASIAIWSLVIICGRLLAYLPK
jgi:hypothetical protein